MGYIVDHIVYTLLLLQSISVPLVKTEDLEANNVTSLIQRLLPKGCNLFKGEWMVDNSYPLYQPSQCPFIQPEFGCIKYGRPDTDYLKYSWKPLSCNLPRFDGMEFFRRWRGKKIMFVGDSLSLNEWQSLCCMVYASAPNSKHTYVRTTLISSLTYEEYGVSISLYHTNYLVDIIPEKKGRILKLDSLQGGSVWKEMDMLIFNTFHWYLHTGKEWDYVQDGSTILKNMNRLTLFNKALNSWARWVELNIDPSKTRVFFQGISATHYKGAEWSPVATNCSGQQKPLPGSTYPGGEPEASRVLSNVLKTMKTPVYLLDITTLSQLRVDGYPSTYSGLGVLDCSHWCLPGVPDTWNQLLYAALTL